MNFWWDELMEVCLIIVMKYLLTIFYGNNPIIISLWGSILIRSHKVWINSYSQSLSSCLGHQHVQYKYVCKIQSVKSVYDHSPRSGLRLQPLQLRSFTFTYVATRSVLDGSRICSDRCATVHEELHQWDVIRYCILTQITQISVCLPSQLCVVMIFLVTVVMCRGIISVMMFHTGSPVLRTEVCQSRRISLPWLLYTAVVCVE